MDCLKNLSAKLFLCFAILVGCAYISALDVEAEEIAKTTKTAETVAVKETADITDSLETPESILVPPVASPVLVDANLVNPELTDVSLANPVLVDINLAGSALADTSPIGPALVDANLVNYSLASSISMNLVLIDPGLIDPNLLEFQRLAKRAQDVEMLSRLIQTEGGYAFEDKVCVALTVLHRVDNPDFPDTVEETINEPSQYANLAKGEVLEENAQAAEYAMEVWENGTSYSILPSQFLFFHGNGKKNSFHDYHGQYYKLPKLF